jgi:hypothetical protein
MVTENEGLLVDSLAERYLSEQYLCEDLFKICPRKDKLLDYKDYVSEIHKNKNKNQTHPKSKK